MPANQNKLIVAALAPFIVACFAVAGYWIWQSMTGEKWVPAPESGVLSGVARLKLDPGAPIEVYADEAKKELGLPQKIRQDKNKAVISAVEVKAGDRDRQVAIVIDSETAKVETFIMEKPLPWFRREESGAVRLDFDVRSKTSELSIRKDLLQTKALHWGVAGRVNTNTDWAAMVGVEWRF